MNQNELKQIAAKAALEYIIEGAAVGVGTGSTVEYFIEFLSERKHLIDGAVPSSKRTEAKLKKLNIPVLDLNVVHELPVYIDSADEYTKHFELTKGGGGAHTCEKIVAMNAKEFVCIVDESKSKPFLGEFPIAVEVLPIARSYVAREIVKLGGDPSLRENFTTDNGNIVLDVFNLDIKNPSQLEAQLNAITGVVENGIFAKRKADVILVATSSGVQTL